MGDIFDAIENFDVSRVAEIINAGQINLLLTKSVSSFPAIQGENRPLWSRQEVNPLCHPFLWVTDYVQRNQDRSAIINLLLESSQYQNVELLKSFRVRVFDNAFEEELYLDFDEDDVYVTKLRSFLQGCLANFGTQGINEPYYKIAHVLFKKGLRISDEESSDVCDIFFGMAVEDPDFDPYFAWFKLFCLFGYRLQPLPLDQGVVNVNIERMYQIQQERNEELTRVHNTIVHLVAVGRKRNLDGNFLEYIMKQVFK